MIARVHFLGVTVDPWTMRDTVDEIGRRIESACFTQHVVINVAKLIAMRTDRTLRQAIEACEIINADGMGIVWGARALGLPIPERVAGVDLFLELLELASRHGYSITL